MNISFRSRRKALGGLGIVSAVALFTVLIVQAAPAAPTASTGFSAPAHKCLVATGSGDPAFVRNFNPYVQGIPSSSFVRGGMYEPLVITTPAGGGKEYKWLAQSYAWSKDGKQITLNLRTGVKWSDGKPLTAADVVYSLTAGKQDKTMDMIGAYREGTNIASIKQKGANQVVIALKTKDSQFVAGQPERRLHRAQARVLEGRGHQQVPQPEPGRLRAVLPGGEVQHAVLHAEQEPELLAGGHAEGPVRPVHPGNLERRGAAPDPQWTGRLDA